MSGFKVSGQLVNSDNPAHVLLNDWYMSAAIKGSAVFQRCSVVVSLQRIKKLSGLIAIVDVYVLFLCYVTSFSTLTMHAYVLWE